MSNDSPWRLKLRWSSGRERRLSRLSLPVSRPEASGTRARTPTSRAAASARNRSAGRWRTMLKMIWTLATPGYSMRLEGLLHPLHAHPVVGDDAVCDQLVEGREHLRAVVDVRRRAVQLDQVDALHAEVLAAAGQPAREGLGRVVGGDLLDAAAHLGRHDDPLAALAPGGTGAMSRSLWPSP